MNTDDNLYDGYIKTISGRRIYLNGGDPSDLQIKDIAHALSNVARFSGHTIRRYSVAEHCLLVVDLLRNWGCKNPKTLLTGLMHDATEAYLPDIPTPYKVDMPEFKAKEEKLWIRIAARFDLYEKPEDVPHADIVNVVMGLVTAENLGRSLIKHADRTALFIEASILQPEGDVEEWPEYDMYRMLARDWKEGRQSFYQDDIQFRVCGGYPVRIAFLREYNNLASQCEADRTHQQETFHVQP